MHPRNIIQPKAQFLTIAAGAILGALFVAANIVFAAGSINSASVGGGSSVTLAPGATTTAVINVTSPSTSTADRWRSTAWRIATSAPGTTTCVDTQNHSNQTASESFPITAPTQPGTYNAYFTTYSDNNCQNDPSSTFVLQNAVIVPSAVTVTIHKYVDGTHANATTAEGQSFPMQSSWNAQNIGSGSGTFSLAPSSYDAQTASMTAGASYSTNEDTSQSSVGSSCASGKPFALVGYSVGDTEALAAAAPMSTSSPSLTNITTNKHVIVWNKDCTPMLTVQKIVINDNGGTATTSSFTLFIDNATTTSGVATSTTIGQHVVRETSNANYTGTIGGDCNAQGQVTFAAGDRKTCTITNNDVPNDVKVTIVKFINGQHATTGSAMSASFPMQSSWNAVNLGGPGSGTYSLSPSGFNTQNAYEAVTANMSTGSSYATNENTSTSVVGTSCANGQQFRLLGYTTGNTLSAAQGASTTTTSPSFTNLTSDKWVIVWNVPCNGTSTPPTPPPPPPPSQNACNQQPPQGFTVRQGTSGNDKVTLAPNTMFIGNGGNDKVMGGNGNYILCLGNGNDRVELGNGDVQIDAGQGNNKITVGNGTGSIRTGNGNDKINTGSGMRTINAGAGNNTIVTGADQQTITTLGGNDKIDAGDGPDVIQAGNGNNDVFGRGGNDTITTGAGDDEIDGGPGTDSCSAGGGFNNVVNCES